MPKPKSDVVNRTIVRELHQTLDTSEQAVLLPISVRAGLAKLFVDRPVARFSPELLRRVTRLSSLARM